MNSFRKHDEPVLIWTGKAIVDGVLTIPDEPEGIIIIAGLGGTFHHDTIRSIAAAFHDDRFATLIADVLTADEQQFDARTGHFRVDTTFLASRLRDIVEWTMREAVTRDFPVALFASSSLATAALDVAHRMPLVALAVAATRFDAVRDHLGRLERPTLLMFENEPAVERFRAELRDSGFDAAIAIVPGVSALLENEIASSLAAQESSAWFRQHVPVLSVA